MGKTIRCWHKLPCLPLRLSLLILCAWAVYTISTGFIYPSVRSATPFPGKMQKIQSRRHVNRNLSLADSEADLKRHFEKHLVPKSDKIQAKFQTGPPNANTKNSYYGVLTISSKSSSLLRDETTKSFFKSTSKDNKKLGSEKMSLINERREKKYRNSGISYHVQTNAARDQNFRLNKLTNDAFVHQIDFADGTSSGRRKQTRKKHELLKHKAHQSAIDVYKSKTYLRNISNIKNYGSNTSSLNHGIAFFTIHTYKQRSPSYHQSADHKARHTSHASSGSSEIKTILLWTPLYKGWNFLPEGTTAFSHCSETHCEITSNRNRLKESDAVIFHIRTMSLLDLPPFRLPHQKWIFFSLEPPPQSYFPGFHFMHRMFNWTMTYRSDSDIVIPYGRVIPGNFSSKNNKTKKNWEIWWKNKARPVVWMVSHCDTYSKRERFVRQLQKFIDVDILGGCGTAVCLFNQTYKCLEAFSKRYKFFLAFENSICDDYVTEKFFRALRYDIVPVVLGGADYKTVAPPGAYINAADFHSPKELADYLHSVSENSDLYATYFKWKDSGYTVVDKPNHCVLCEKMHSLDFKATSTYTDIAKWWVENSHCTKWTPK